jgi:cyclophilin family peptidyl-prolyl cis-trans isomerase
MYLFIVLFFSACLNFLKLCKAKYYNLSLFHSVQRGFIAQTGDPTGTGRGGESVFGQGILNSNLSLSPLFPP